MTGCGRRRPVACSCASQAGSRGGGVVMKREGSIILSYL